MNLDHQQLQQWIGRTETRSDVVTAAPVAAMAATLDMEPVTLPPGSLVPPLWHWLYFLPLHRHSELGGDGHGARGEFLPPVPLPHRMWAGGRLRFMRPLQIGENIERVSRVENVEVKQGRSGSLVFVLVRHEISGANGPALVEEHDIVYRGAGASLAPGGIEAPRDSHWEELVTPDAVLLFRYSALTFNGHRIHYDRSYTTGVEHYPGLIVHGPLIAMLLLEQVRRHLPHAQVASYEFRALRPLFDTAPFSICGNPSQDGKSVELWARDAQGMVAMEATATLV